MSTGGHTWLPRVFKQADQRVNECVTDGPSRECFASRKPADRNQPRMPHRREVGNVDHGNRLIEWRRDFGNGHKLTVTRLEIGQVNAALGANMFIVWKATQSCGVLSNLASSSAKGAVPSCPAEAVVEQRQMLGVPKWIGGAEVCVREVRLEKQERSQRGRRFRYPRGMPKRGNEPVVGTDILRLSVNRVCRSINSAVDVAKQKARERQVG